ncbi:MAG: hypothetical protein H6522_09695 [Mycolicibacterium sp.]|nr:hypothetical protein [Mycolicibacterium sp.]
MVDPVRGSANFVARVVELGSAGVTELARIGGNSLLAALLALLGGRTDEGSRGAADEPDEASPVEVITSGLLAGEGRYTRLEVAERVGVPLDEARRLWRALGFPEVDDEQAGVHQRRRRRPADAVALVAADIVDENRLVELAAQLGNLMSRLAAAQTTSSPRSWAPGSRWATTSTIRSWPTSWPLRRWPPRRSCFRYWSAPRCTPGAGTWPPKWNGRCSPTDPPSRTWWRVGRRWSVSST